MNIKQSLGLWIPQVQGQYINVDAAAGAQCWDLAAHWSAFLGLPRISTWGKGRWPGWAGNMVDAFPQSPEIAAAYELLPPSAAAQGGDIAVWGDAYWYYPKTHVAVVVRDGGLLTCMSQNSTPARTDNPYPADTTGPTTIQALPKTGLIGYIRPRTGLAPQGTITPQEDDDLALFENETVFRDKVISAVFDARFDTRDEKNNITGTISLRDMLTYYAANIALDRRQLRDGLAASVKTIAAAVKAGQSVDPDAIAKEIVDSLGGITLKVVTEGAK